MVRPPMSSVILPFSDLVNIRFAMSSTHCSLDGEAEARALFVFELLELGVDVERLPGDRQALLLHGHGASKLTCWVMLLISLESGCSL